MIVRKRKSAQSEPRGAPKKNIRYWIQRGASFIEFVAIFPVLFFFVVGLIDIVRYWAVRIVIQAGVDRASVMASRLSGLDSDVKVTAQGLQNLNTLDSLAEDRAELRSFIAARDEVLREAEKFPLAYMWEALLLQLLSTSKAFERHSRMQLAEESKVRRPSFIMPRYLGLGTGINVSLIPLGLITLEIRTLKFAILMWTKLHFPMIHAKCRPRLSARCGYIQWCCMPRFISDG